MDVNGAAAERYEIRQGTLADFPAVKSFTTDTWGEGSDYVPHVYRDWMASEGATQRTFVAVDHDASPPDALAEEGGDEVDDARPVGRAVGVCQAVTLSEHEGWVQAMRVDGDYRGEGLSTALNDAAFRWLADGGCVVGRNMVFSWNVAGLGGSQAAGFDPCTEFRWAHPDPDADAVPGTDEVGDLTEDLRPTTAADAAWSFWQGCRARTHLRGLALDAEESWAMSELTRERLRSAAAEDRLLAVGDAGVRGLSIRNRSYDRENDDGETETWVEYAVGAWADPAACRSLLGAIARDAAGCGADRTRVLIPESAQWVTDVAAARVNLSDEPDFVMAADLTQRPWDRS